MKHVPVLVLAILLMFGCKKDKSSRPTAATEIKGTLQGKVAPLNSTKLLTLLRWRNDQVTAISVLPDDQGNFSFSGLSGGKYTLVIAPSDGYVRPEDRVILVSDSHPLVLATITVLQMPVLPSPAAQKGSLVGKISPAEAATGVSISNISGSQQINYDPKTGIFFAENLSEGRYSIYVSSNWKFIGPDPMSVEVKAGNQTDAGMIVYKANEKMQSLSFRLGTRAIVMDTYLRNSSSTSVSATCKDGVLNISGYYGNGNSEFLAGRRDIRFAIKLNNISGPGSYRCEGTEGSRIDFDETFRAPLVRITTKLTSTKNVTVLISTFDPVAKRIAGTFSGTFNDSSGIDSRSQQITEGVFDLSYN